MHDFIWGQTHGQVVEDHRHHDTRAADARLAVAHCKICHNCLLHVHHCTVRNSHITRKTRATRPVLPE